jgi:hypothetical protein
MRKKSNKLNQRGQSMIETALMFPILLLLFAGMIEVVFICRSYLIMLDSSYQGAHLGSLGEKLFDNIEIKDLVFQNLPPEISNNLINKVNSDLIITRASWNGSMFNDPDTDFCAFCVYHYNTTQPKTSIFSQTILAGRLAGRPATRLIIVEVVYDYQLPITFPLIKNLIPEKFPLVAYTIQYVARK